MDDFVRRSHINDDVPDDVDKERLGLFPKLDSGKLEQPL